MVSEPLASGIALDPVHEALDDIGDFFEEAWDDTRDFIKDHPIISGALAIATGTWFISAAGGFAAAGAKLATGITNVIGSFTPTISSTSIGASINVGSFASASVGAGVNGLTAFAGANVSILGVPVWGVGSSLSALGSFGSTIGGSITNNLLGGPSLFGSGGSIDVGSFAKATVNSTLTVLANESGLTTVHDAFHATRETAQDIYRALAPPPPPVIMQPVSYGASGLTPVEGTPDLQSVGPTGGNPFSGLGDWPTFDVSNAYYESESGDYNGTRLVAGYFFDGTGNDKLRDMNDPGYMGTHVAALSLMYQDARAYTHGVGTRTDVAYGNAFGLGAQERVDSMFARFEENWAAGDRDVDIFGFSRGSAMARDFANRVSEEYPDANIRFLGLFDTVAQMGLPDTGNINLGFNLDIPENVGFTAHAVARDEYRNLFPLTSIVSSFNQTTTESSLGVYQSDSYRYISNPSFAQVPFDGAHSDVGGGYVDGTNLRALRWMYEKAVEHGVPLDWSTSEFQEVASRYKFPSSPTSSQVFDATNVDSWPSLPNDIQYHDSRWKIDFFDTKRRRVFPGNLDVNKIYKPKTPTPSYGLREKP